MARLLLDTDLLSAEGRLHYECRLEQGEAFLDCRYGNFKQARRRTLNSLAIGQVLEDQYGRDKFILHRIQQVHNLARIEAYDCQPKKAIRLTLEILSYLDGKLDILSVPGEWGHERIARQPSSNVAGMFVQVAGEIALIMAGLDSQRAGELFIQDADELLTTNYQQSRYPHAYSWLLVKQAFSRNDIDDFLTRAADFIAKRYEGMELLWYGTVVDLITLCHELDTPEAAELKYTITRDIMSRPAEVPPKFLEVIKLSGITQAEQFPPSENLDSLSTSMPKSGGGRRRES